MALSLFKRSGPKEGSIEEAMANSGGGGAPEEPDQKFPQPFLPSVSLVPESRLSLLRRRKAMRRAFVIGMFVVAGLVVALAALLATLLASQSAEDQAVTQRDIAMTEASVLMPVQDLYEGFERRQRAVANALSSDVDYYSLILQVEDAIQAEIPRDALMEDESGQWYVKEDYAHIGLRSYTVSASPCPTDEPFDPGAALGCIQASAVSSSYAAAGEAMRLLNEADNGLFGAYVLGVSEGSTQGQVGSASYSFTVNFGAEALSGKYAQESEAILGEKPEPVTAEPEQVEPTAPAQSALPELGDEEGN